MHIAYLTNQYPKVSHSFIRREICELESRGLHISRLSIRRVAEQLVDPQDVRERDATTYLLDTKFAIAIACLSSCLRSPRRTLRSFVAALRLGNVSRRGMAFHLIYWLEACFLARWLISHSVDHVHVHFGTNPATVMLLANLISEIPFSITCHGPEEFDLPIEISLGAKIEAAAFVVGVSSFGRSQLYRWCALEHWTKIKVVHCGVDAALLDHVPTPVPETRRLVCVGRLCEQKGQLLLLKAVADLHSQGTQLELVLVGDGPMRPQLEEFIVQHDLGNCVTITGWQDATQVIEHLKNARAMVLPSFAEGLPVVIMEAFAIGRPVISTYVAGIPELVRPGGNGWLIPAGDVDALANAVGDALHTPIDLVTQMGLTGRSAVLERHDITKEVSKLAELFAASDDY